MIIINSLIPVVAVIVVGVVVVIVVVVVDPGQRFSELLTALFPPL